MSEQGLIMWIRIVLNEEFKLFDLPIIKELTLVSRGIANTLKPHIEKKYRFALSETKRSITIPCIEGEEDFSAKIFNREFDKMVPGKIRSYSRNGTDLTIHYDDFKHPTIRRVTYYSPTKQRGVNSFEEISPSIQQIVFSNGFDEPIDNNLSNAITHIHFGEQFNSPISALPLNLIELTFHRQGRFNQPITAFITTNITKLTFPKSFLQFIEALPPKVVEVNFRNCNYNEPLHHLSEKIKFLRYLGSIGFRFGCGELG
eukprot:TRINITY_DN2098_c1_g1_i9.p1 TRINITY_DN2098_c1_g1~~TRINITY_DN2098_c1_g1_i9.p1  ORF type:complete len:258 (+),score=42.03 TRINITY_DN2098_c1_g1_i9:306-1079(+)